MALLTREDWRRQSPFAWLALLALAGVAAWFWMLDRRGAAEGTLASLIGCLGLVLPPRERMPVLPAPIRALPRGLDALPVLGALLVSPGYGLNWFYGANPYDEVVHLLNGIFAGAIFVALLEWRGPARRPWRLATAAAGFGLILGSLWEVFEAMTGLSGDWTDTWTDAALTTGGAAIAGLVAGWRAPRPAGGMAD
ncbi:hypothetical protein JMJ55_16295 [Belnapia sp. T6]|uniref:VanZ like family protein n=1 Tax=Belnapia mucosa TaxID=2804532 RepID=A0ABS1V5C4_9PROT|nr:hypothetical protein [Belnapia mucosa]MBL6456898.1 hypothetical protein [Belnapia mucosa]